MVTQKTETRASNNTLSAAITLSEEYPEIRKQLEAALEDKFFSKTTNHNI